MNCLPVVLAPRTHVDFGGSTPACLHPLLGDACLLWVLRALPASESPVLILHGDDAVPAAVARWASEGLLTRPVNCQSTEETAPEPMLLSAGVQLSHVDGFGLCFADAPLVEPAVLARALKESPLTWERVSEALEARTSLADALPIDSPWRHLLGSPRLTRRWNLPELQRLARTRIAEGWMARGASLPDPDAVTIGPRVRLAADVLVEAGVRLEGDVHVGEGTCIGQGSVFRNCTLGCEVEVRPYCVGEGAIVGDRVKLGPFAHLREGTVLEDEVHVGNFVETKKAHLRRGAKANHLSYLGDAEIGERTNIGAGCITCNYDGFKKHRTVIGREAFIGSDCQLVAPVTLGDYCMIAAGTTVTRDVPTDALAIARVPQTLKEGYARLLRERLKGKST